MSTTSTTTGGFGPGFAQFRHRLWTCLTPLIFIHSFLFLSPTLVNSQGSFPQLINAAEEKAISTSPELGSCGYLADDISVTSAFCISSTLQASVSSCNLKLCQQDCRQRSATPDPITLLSIANAGSCVTPDPTIRPGAEEGTSSFLFRNDPSCFVTPSVTPTIGTNGEFTLTVWLRLDVQHTGTIIEKRDENDEIIFAIITSSTQINFDYNTSDGLKTLTVNGGLGSTIWRHLAVQVYGTTASFFIDGLESDATPFDSQVLQGQILDSSLGNSRIGQPLTGATQYQYVGRMQDLHYYQQTLTNREIEEIASGTFPSVHSQSECRCPDSHPRVNPLDSKLCIPNGVPDTSSDVENRLNENAHPLQFSNDGDLGSYWISAFIDDIIISVDLTNGQYQVFYIVLQFYSPQPKALTVERKKLDNSAWEAWQFFADDCLATFGMENNGALLESDSVNCLQFQSDSVVYSKGNITFQLLSPEPVSRPGYNDFYNNPELLEFVLAAQVRLRLQGHYHVLDNRHKYYGIEEITFSARCECNGHASSCDMSLDPYQCDCLTESFTDGSNCEKCQPMYNNKPFHHGDQVSAYNCKLCECHGHASSCTYQAAFDPFPDSHDLGGGGVCTECQHNTAGNSCETCIAAFYREEGKSLEALDVCTPCVCNANGILDGNLDCEKVGGQCSCKQYVTGRQCDTCLPLYHNLQSSNPEGCEPCNCNAAGTQDGGFECEENDGKCVCKTNVIGDQCDECNSGYYNLDANSEDGCTSCNCNLDGSLSEFCDPSSGQCQCKNSTTGRQCNQCLQNYYGLTGDGCQLCGCSIAGQLPSTTCDIITGECVCKAHVEGVECDQCVDGYYNLESSNVDGCSPCNCNTAGTVDGAITCDLVSGQCLCKPAVGGLLCDSCTSGTYALDDANPDGCQPCDCDLSGSVSGDCDGVIGQCTCLTGRTGRRCDSCSTGYYPPPDNGDGCLACDCHTLGSVTGTTCDPSSGQCVCQIGDDYGITGQKCNECLPQFWNFDDSLGKCTPCSCDLAGSVNNTCDSSDGQCYCKLYVTGDTCNSCIDGTSNLDANNPYGCSKKPEQQPVPTATALTPFSILLQWNPPDEPNGDILNYILYRNSQMVYQGITNIDPLGVQEYTDNGLLAYTEYTYYVEAFNLAGSTDSPTVTIRTPDDITSGFNALQITNVKSTTADVSWSKPIEFQGIIESYTLTSVTPTNPAPALTHYQGLDTAISLSNLIPFTNYTFTLIVCTEDGCGQSLPLSASTEHAPPEGVLPPNTTAISSQSIYIEWQHPEEANGIITHYELFMRGMENSEGVRDPVETKIFSPEGWYNPRPIDSVSPLDPPETNFTQTALKAYTQYEFKVAAHNDAGTGESDWVIERTLEDAPFFVAPPMVFNLSSTELNVTWSIPTESEIRGQITIFKLYLISEPEITELIYMGDANTLFFIAFGFVPNTEYQFFVEVCNSIGCINSTKSFGKTLAAAPEEFERPSVSGYNSTVMSITWEMPLKLNGPTPSYTVERSLTSFSDPPRVNKGVRFPGGGYFLFPQDTILSASYTGIELEFRTERPADSQQPVDALLLFAVSDGLQEEYIVLQLRGGRPWFLFDPQGGAAAITLTDDGDKTYDDGEWHHLLAQRAENQGVLTVDGIYSGVGNSAVDNAVIGENTGVYLGGLPTDFPIVRTDSGNAEVIQQGFIGCIRNVKIEVVHTPSSVWEELDWSTAISNTHTVSGFEGCPTGLQPATHYLGGGFASLPVGTFTGGSAFLISFEFRTSFTNGLLLFAHGTNGAHLILELASSNLQMRIYTGSGSEEMVHTDSNVGELCDGQWYSVTFTMTLSQIAVNLINGVYSDVHSTGSLPITSELYLGGVPLGSDADLLMKSAGLSTQPGFGGCMRSLKINIGDVIVMGDQVVSLLNVNLDGCPEASLSDGNCQSVTPTNVYNGLQLNSLDFNLNVFTEYLYKVIVSNTAGSTESEWSVGRTKEGAPTGVSAPLEPQSSTGYLIQARWQRPTGNTGVLTEYILTAYDQDRPNTLITAVFTDTSELEYTGNISDVTPFTNYMVTLTACTSGGCTESDGVNIQTTEEVPSGVEPPVASEKTSNSLTLIWMEPSMPNGVLTGYQIIFNGGLVFSGLDLTYTQTGLSSFTEYKFILKACNQQGCTDSEEVTIVTEEEPPSLVFPPLLFVLGSRTVEVDWKEPENLKGELERYIIYQSENQGELGEVVHNSTATTVLTFTLTTLMPNTFYYVSVAACTGGGCTFSDQSSAQTFEDVPEGVPSPTVTALSSSSLFVTWTQPTSPNGVIVNYTLYHSSVGMQTGLEMSYTVSGLTPWTLYTFRVEACTAKGCSVGPSVEARTLEDAPLGSILLNVSTADSRTVSAQWTSPSQPNGLMSYELAFTGLYYNAPENNNFNTQQETRILYNGTIVDTLVVITDLIPYSTYSVQVNGYNTIGFLLSNIIMVDMPQGTPDGVSAPVVDSFTSNSITVEWAEPERINAPGNVTYQLLFRPALNPEQEENLFSSPSTVMSYTKTDLLPFTQYEFQLVVTNAIGSTSSEWISAVTSEDKPGSVDPPKASVVDSWTLLVTWDQPTQPNGVIQTIFLYQNNQLLASLMGNTTSYTAGGLTPYTSYYYRVEVCNSIGCTTSTNSITYTTPATNPGGVSPPSLNSDTPTSIIVTWSAPQEENGIIQSYVIERRLEGTNSITTVVTTNPQDSFSHLDTSEAISPYTTYEYRVVVWNNAGSTPSEWAQVTTKEAAPGGLLAPEVVVLGSTSFQISWQPPTEPNGILISYTVKLTDFLILLDNTSLTSYTASNLIPYTQYSVTIQACTIGGCIESSAVSAETEADSPQGQAAPKVDAITQTSIFVLWESPLYPNGPDIRYELHRMKIAQPLETGPVTGLEFWEFIYEGTNQFLEDKSLTTYTTYQYRVTVYNSIGNTVSELSEEVTTLAGQPLQPGTISVEVIDHTSVNTSWTTPSILELQGAVETYIVNYQSLTTNEMYYHFFTNDVSSAVINSLSPNTLYEFTLTIDNGAYNITSSPVLAETQVGAPTGFEAPEFFVLSSTSGRIVWSPPAEPNGDILGYKVYLDNIKIADLQSDVLLYELDNLAPYTVYEIKVEVCTVHTCLMSNVTLIATLETLPQDAIPPSLLVMGPDTISLNWAAPATPNGIITRYQLLRRDFISCDLELIAPNSGDTNLCTFVQCTSSEDICGTSCFSPLTQTCCNGVVFESKPDFECCEMSYISERTSSDDVCCGGQFHPYQSSSHQCCGGQYLEVLSGQVCCIDPDQDTVLVGTGDSCCTGIPYDSSGPQICCEDQFQDGYDSQCCGGIVVGSEMVCCGDVGGESLAYPTDEDRQCCGTEYINSQTTLCCVSESGAAQSYVYSSQAEMIGAGDQCCGVEKIPSSLLCCNNVGYDPASYVCADRDINSQINCGSGTVCPIELAATAYCDSCDFDPNINGSCIVVSGNFEVTSSDLPETSNNELCATDFELVYDADGKTTSYLDTGLSAYTTYEYTLLAWNSIGSAKSEAKNGTTDQDIPSGVQVPDWSLSSGQLDTILLTWKLPLLPNGEIIYYILLRDDVEIYKGTEMSYTDSNSIQPYEDYVYVLQACTIIGCNNSEPAVAATLQSAPEGFVDPIVQAIDAYSIQISWNIPSKPNGVITSYKIYLDDIDSLIYTATTDEFQYTYLGLEPFSQYSFIMSVCTVAGCSYSSQISATTLEASPQGVSILIHIIISVNEVEIFWTEPTEPNGIITGFQLYKSGSLVYTGEGGILNYKDVGLLPNTQYEYILRAINSAGSTDSAAYSLITPESTPQGIPAPLLTAKSSTQIYGEWDEPTLPNGDIDQYGLVFLSGTESQFTEYSATNRSLLVDGLTPYTSYDIRVQACTSGGCAMGPPASVQTLAAKPEGQGPPDLVASGPTVIDISWIAPSSPNGIITKYYVYRKLQGSSQELLIWLKDASSSDTDTTIYTYKDASTSKTAFTAYEYRVRSMNSLGFADSAWALVVTLEGLSEGLVAPQLLSPSSYAIQATWLPPSFPNGAVVTYRIEYMQVITDPTLTSSIITAATVSSSTFQITFYGLTAYTSYEVRVVVTNGAGEVQSPWAQITTVEGIPSGIQPLKVEQMTDGTAVLLTWEEPDSPNGQITVYNIYEDPFDTPVYVGLTRQYELRRLTPYMEYILALEACTQEGCAKGSPQSVWTAEVMPANQAPPTMGFSNSTTIQLNWKPPVDSNGLITHYDIYRRSATLVARRKRQAEELVYTEPVIVYTEYNTDSEDFSYTDTNLLPYTIYDYQVLASNSKGFTESEWISITTSQAAPEGVDPPTVERVPENPLMLKIYWESPAKPNGIIQGYSLQRNSSVPFSFGADQFEFLDTTVSAFTVYTYTITACSSGGCASSVPTLVQTLEVAPAFVDLPMATALSSTEMLVNWTQPSTATGQIISYEVVRDMTIQYPVSLDSMEYTVTGLLPFQEYSFALSACTTGGCTSSEETIARTLEAPPTDMQAPTLVALSANAIEITWESPNNPNGEITAYELLRDGKLIYSGKGTYFQDFGDGGEGLVPGQQYSYYVVAYNSQGFTQSPSTSISTSSSTPAGQGPPILEVESSTSIRASWSPPLYPNGDIVNYTLLVNTLPVYSGLELSYTAINLSIYTEYELQLQVCTSTGCAYSQSVTAITLEDSPTDLLPPSITPLYGQVGKVSALIQWNPPQQPNGLITGYEVYRQQFFSDSDLYGSSTLLGVFNGDENQYFDLDPSLEPAGNYEYQVAAANSVGQVFSDWQPVQMLPTAPEGVYQPEFTDITATEAVILIKEPVKPNGDIISYTIIVNGTEVVSTLLKSYQLTGLLPNNLYEVKISACTLGGCSTSESGLFYTLELEPMDLMPPIIAAIDFSWIYITWVPPIIPNGVILGYSVYERISCAQPFYSPADIENCRDDEFGLLETVEPNQLEYNVTDLDAYMAYDFLIETENGAGSTKSEFVTVETLDKVPEYVEKPIIQLNNVTLVVDWSKSFKLNGPLDAYILVENGDTVYTGTSVADTRPLEDKTYEFKVTCRTLSGEVSSPALFYFPPIISAIQDTPWYLSTWFFILLGAVAFILILLFIMGICCLNKRSQKYQPDRNSLVVGQKGQRSSKLNHHHFLAACGYSPNESLMDPIPTEISQSQSSSQISTDKLKKQVSGQYSYTVNPIAQRGGIQLIDEKYDKNSMYLEDNDGAWDPTYSLPLDSSMAYELDGEDPTLMSEETELRPYSVSKEQTMFTDTHL